MRGKPKLAYWLHKRINLKTGIMVGLVTGSIVYYINYKHGPMVALSAFTKQFFYNLLMAGFNSSLCERLAKSIKNRWLAIFLASLVPTTIAFIGVFSVHYFLNTPDPLANTLWQAYCNIILFFITGLAYHKELERKYKWVRILISSKRRLEMGFYDSE
jgi:hypothetical protein